VARLVQSHYAHTCDSAREPGARQRTERCPCDRYGCHTFSAARSSRPLRCRCDRWPALGLAQSTSAAHDPMCWMLASRVSPASILGPVLPRATSVACPDRYRVRQLRAGPQKLLSARCRPRGQAGRPRLAPRRGLPRAGLRVDAASSARSVAGTHSGWQGWSLRHAGPIAWPLAHHICSVSAGTRRRRVCRHGDPRPGHHGGPPTRARQRADLRRCQAAASLGPRLARSAPVQRTACAGSCRPNLVSRNRASLPGNGPQCVGGLAP
jgi:hypothetical protein